MTDSKDKEPPGKEPPEKERLNKAASDKASEQGGGEETIVLGGSFVAMVEAERKKEAGDLGGGDGSSDLPAGTPEDPFGEAASIENAAPAPMPEDETVSGHGGAAEVGNADAPASQSLTETAVEAQAERAVEHAAPISGEIATDIPAEHPGEASLESESLSRDDVPTETPPAEAQSAGAQLAAAMTVAAQTATATGQLPGDAGPEALFEALSERAHDFGFFPLIRRLENYYRDKPRIGESVRPADDPIRLGQVPSVVFAPSTLRRFERGEDGKPDRLYGFFLGLFGPNGPLPLHLSEFARDRSRNYRDDTFTAFADTFHHRLLSLFYRAWASGEPAVSFDRPDDDRFSRFVASTCGRGMEAFRHRDYMPDVGKLYFAGRLALQTRNAEGLMAIISDFFKVPVAIRQFVGEWLELPEHQLCRLGESSLTGALGVNTTVGRRVWSCQYKFRLIFGPVSLKDYKRLLPGGKSLERLVAVVRNYIGDELSWDVNLILKKDEVPAIRLGQTGNLGWTTWLLPRRDERNANDLYLHPLRMLQAKG